MAVRPEQRGIELAERGLDVLAEAALALGLAGSLSEAMQIVVKAAGRATGAEVVVARVADDARRSLNACAVATSSAAVGAELEGSRLPLEDVPDYEVGELERLPESVRRAAERVRASSVLLIPVQVNGRVEGGLELMRRGDSFGAAGASGSHAWRRGKPRSRSGRLAGRADELYQWLRCGWGARIRTWEWRNQNPLPYHLATPHQQIGAARVPAGRRPVYRLGLALATRRRASQAAVRLWPCRPLITTL